jgi:hypothetical protein
VLLDLESLDVPESDAFAANENDGSQTDCNLHAQATAKAVLRNHQNAAHAGKRGKDDHVAINAVKEEKLVADNGHELQEGEDTGRKGGAKVKKNANATSSRMVVEALARECIGLTLVFRAEDVIDTEVHQTGERETEKCAGGNGPEDEVVALGETDGVVNLPYYDHEAVGRGAIYLNHG